MSSRPSDIPQEQPVEIPPAPGPGSTHAEWREWSEAMSKAGRLTPAKVTCMAISSPCQGDAA